ncbi:SAM-dependent methyltransferase [Alcanivorax sp. N3-2A]|nr:SAM-dependent methyltransferase [Alcanivorax sp. N3-2A]|tara:strand:- start:59274 stop:60071 length:798 start_codon:yes stop_codon:yes gene_type:complete
MRLPPLARRPFRRHPEDMPERFDRWLDSEAGAAVLAAERAMLADLLPRMVGQRAVEVASGRGRDMLAGIRLPWRCAITASGFANGQVQALPQALPVAKNSVDVMLLHHGLEFHDAPHQVLREAARCVAPGGVLAVVGFHPLSPMGLARWVRTGANRPGWNGRYFRPYRVSDWLHVLGFEVEGLASGFHNLPLSDRGRARLRWLEWLGEHFWWRYGGVYLLVARKRAAMLRPAAPARRFQRPPPTVISVPVARWRQQRNWELERPE